MPKLEITLTQEQYQYMEEAIRYYNRIHLMEEFFGGYDIILSTPIPDVVESSLHIKSGNTIDLGDVQWRFVHSFNLKIKRK